jgi:hypothetical protein
MRTALCRTSATSATNAIGFVDETMIGQGLQHYTLPCPLATAFSTHILGFRVDAFNNVESSITISNLVLSEVGVSQLFSVSPTTNTMGGLPVYQMTGQAGFDYGLQASSDLCSWTQIGILENTNGAVGFYDPDSTNFDYRFYRVIAPY